MIAIAGALIVGLLQQAMDPVERIAAAGWAEARALAAKGGALDQLGPVNRRLKELDGIPNNVNARYAEVAIRAAVCAAQDERDEMGLFLTHARALSDQMVLAKTGPAKWPLPIDELEGELWLEVDRYLEARDAYQRATATGGARAWMGLARASDRLGQTKAACDAYNTAQLKPGLTAADRKEIAAYAPQCQN
jgi:hypothetical protein